MNIPQMIEILDSSNKNNVHVKEREKKSGQCSKMIEQLKPRSPAEELESKEIFQKVKQIEIQKVQGKSFKKLGD